MKIYKKLVTKSCMLSLVMCLCFINTSCSQENTLVNNNTSTSKKIDSLVNLYLNYEGFNGAVLVSHKGEVVYKNGLGFSNLEWDIPNKFDTKFRIASVTKPFTAILIMQLVADNKLDLHKPISTYLPDYPKTNGSQITIHHLLTHSSGTVRDYESKNKQNKYPDRQRPEKLIQDFAHLPLEFKPGEKFEYSNSGYLVLGAIIETITGKSYEEVLKEKILLPLNLKNTGADKHRQIIKKRAYGYFKGFGEYFNIDYSDMSGITAVGNMYSTVEDLFLLNQALHKETLMPKEYLDLMFSNHIPDPSYGGHYSYGWEIMDKPIGNTSKMIETVGHSGSMSGFTALYTRIPSSNSTIIFMNNTGRAFLNAMTTAITGILFNETYDFPRKPLAKFMMIVIDREGIDKGIQFYKEHKDLSDYHISEQELIVVGYRFLQAGNAKDAAKIFKLSIEVYPNRDNPYDSYAEALMTLGQNDEAIKNYKKSLELNPKNNNAKEMLKKLEK